MEETNKKINWNLDDILKIDDFENYYKETEKLTDKLEEYWEKLTPEMNEETFKEVVIFDEMLGQRVSRLGHRGGLWSAVDQKNSEARLLESKVDNLSLKYSEKARKINQWIKGLTIGGKAILDDSNANRLFAAVSDLTDNLWFTRKAAIHTLPLKEEEIIQNKDMNGVSALTNLRGLIETDFRFKVKSGNKIKRFDNVSELMVLCYSSNPEDREGAYKALLETHKEHLDKFFTIYQAVVRDWDYEARLRGFVSPISVRNFYNRIPDQAIDNLLEVCRNNREVFQRFFRYKAKEMGMKKLRRFDIYAPIKKIEEKKTDYQKAIGLVLETFKEFSPNFRTEAEKIIKENHIDVYPDKNKRSGAFCSTVGPEVTPYVLLNYTGERRDIYTAAHELGHGIHSLMANKHLPSAQNASLPLAETASTLAETILFEKTYKNETNKDKKKQMLSEEIASAYATIMRQNYFVVFEIKAHEAIKAGVSKEELSEIYLKTLEEQFGDSVEVDPIFAYEWSYIPHIVNSPFYCYSYNFGQLLSWSLFRMYKEKGEEMVGKIEKLLAAGGAEEPETILKEIGVDIRTTEFWQNGFKLISEWQEELERLS